jgi:hypothetical protein
MSELATLDQLKRSLAALAAQEAEKEEKVTSKNLSIKGKRFSIGDTKLGDTLDVIIVAHSFVNTYYSSAYDPDEPANPDCFAVAERNSELKPDPDAADIQSDACKNCPLNEWDSGHKGKGKACKNKRRLVLVAYNTETGEADLDDYVILHVPPTSTKAFASYVRVITSKTKMPTFALVTRLSFDESQDWPVLNFDFLETIEDPELLSQIVEKQEEYTNAALSTDAFKIEFEEEEPVKPVKKVRKTRKSKFSA